MQVSELSPHLVRALGGLFGLAGGVAAGRLADALPPRYEIRHLTQGSARARRNVVLVVLGILIGVALAHFTLMAPERSVARAGIAFGTNLVLAISLTGAAAVDLEHMILPNEVTLGGAALALATAYFRDVGLVGALVGMVAGVAITYLPALLYKKIRGRSGMGIGDAKLALLAGAWLGAEGVLFVIFAGAVQSALSATVMRLAGFQLAVPESVKAEIDELRAKAAAGDAEARELLGDDPMAADVGDALANMRLPLGPFLVLGCLEFLFGQREILRAWASFFDP
ncbi:MAG: prepilin peptidase [Labilithrix sp.]|nr:prepilin peptidase [Labilithrix sp.]